MANVLVNTNNSNVTDAALGINTEHAASVNKKVIQENNSKYEIKDPKTGFLATVFPSESTWHPLYNADKPELLRNLINIDASNDDASTKDKNRKKLKEIYVESFQKKAMGGIIVITIILIIFIIVYLFVLSDSQKKEWGFIIAALIIGALFIGAIVNYKYFARGRGEDKLNNFETDVQSDRNAGLTLAKMLENSENQALQERQTAAMEAASRRSNSRRGNSLFFS